MSNWEFAVGELWNGEKQMLHLTREAELDLEDEEVEMMGPVQVEIGFQYLENGSVLALLESVSGKIKLNCMRCLEDYEQEIELENREAMFGEEAEGEEVVYGYDTKRKVIDVHDFLREEVFLSLPTVRVCKESCKGLCCRCGKNLNKGKCACKPLSMVEEKRPFADLGEMFKK